MDIPNASSHFGVSKKGYLQKLSSRSFPYIPHPWKRKYCVLVKGNLFYYEKDDSRGTDKGTGLINLEYFDQVVEAPAKESKKATHVFVVTSQDRSFFDPGRHLFSADSDHDMQDWIRSLKKSIEQIRNNNRTNNSATTGTAAAAATVTALNPLGGAVGLGSNPASPRISKSGNTKEKQLQVAKKKEPGVGGGLTLISNEEKTNTTNTNSNNNNNSKVGRKKRPDTDANKENVEESLTENNDKKYKYTDTSLRGRRTNPSSRSMDDGSIDIDNLKPNRKKDSDIVPESSSTHSSLGRKQKAKSSAFPKYRGLDLDGAGLTFGSLGRKPGIGKTGKGSASNGGGDSGDSGCSAASGGSSGMERRKRKADEDIEGDMMNVMDTGANLESVTKHRVKGPSGRRMPQSRRVLMMKQRASSLSALAHNADVNCQDNSSNSFIPWLNRSLDLLGEDLPPECVTTQPAIGYLPYSDQEELDDPEEQLYEYNISYHDDRNVTFDENSTGLFIQEASPAGFIQQGADGTTFLATSIVAPPLPPRMESRIDYPHGASAQQTQLHQFQYQQQQQQQLQQQFQQIQFQATFQQQQQNQMSSPFGTLQTDLLSDRELKMQHRKSQPIDELMTRSMTNEVFIPSYSDDNSGDASNPQLNQSQQQNRPQFGSQKQIPQKPNGRSNGQKNRKQMSQPDTTRFTVAVKNLQKHVVELDQAVNEITKEVEDSKVDLGNIKANVVSVKKEKDRLNDAISIVSQEVVKIKDQVAAAVKEAEKMQKTATASLVVAEKAKVDQVNLKKEYESMLKDLKSTIQDIKKDAFRHLAASPSPNIKNKRGHNGSEKAEESDYYEDEISAEDDLEYEINDGRGKNIRRRNKQKVTPRGSTSKLNEVKYEGSSKSGGYQSFFSRPSSIISGLTSIGRSTVSLDGDKEKWNKEKNSKPDCKQSDKKTKKEKGLKGSTDKGNKCSRQLNDDFPMIDETGSPGTGSPVDTDTTDGEQLKENGIFDIDKSVSCPIVQSRPQVLNLIPYKSESTTKATSGASSPDSPTRPSSPFDVQRFNINGRPTSPTGFPLHRPGSTPSHLNRQSSMTTVPEDRAVDLRTLDNRPSDPPPPPPSNRVFAISRQTSTPNIATQKLSTPMGLPRQHSLGVVHEENKMGSRQGSLLSMPDDRLLVDQTLSLSPTPSMMSFPGSWSTTSLNKPDVNVNVIGQERATCASPKIGSEIIKPKGALELVAGGVLSGSSLKSGTICPFHSTDEIGPLATSSLKRRKKVKKELNVI